MARRLAFVALSAALAAAAVFACGTDDLLSGLDLDAGLIFLDGAVQKDGAATSDDDAGTDGTPDGATTPPDAGLLPDGGTDPTTGCQTCDCDHDGYDRPGCGGGTGTDCNDLDPNVHPDAGFATTTPGKDLDCTTTIDKQYRTSVTCPGILLCTGEGFSGEAACGQTAPYVVCGLNGLVCAATTTTTRVQGCR